VSLFVWLVPLDLSGLVGPTSRYATAGIALRVSGALTPHHHDKVGIASVGRRRMGGVELIIAPSFLTSEVDGGECSASHLSRLIFAEKLL
jgi:hypothetical protein